MYIPTLLNLPPISLPIPPRYVETEPLFEFPETYSNKLRKLQIWYLLIGKDSDAGRDWGQEEKGTTKDEMAGWHHGLNGRESE